MKRESLLRCIRGPLHPAVLAVLDAFYMDYAIAVARRLAAIGTYERGFRPAGSRACAEAARYLEENCADWARAPRWTHLRWTDGNSRAPM